MASGMKFIRKHGHIIPIRSAVAHEAGGKLAAGKGDKKKAKIKKPAFAAKSPAKMSMKEYSQFKKGAEASASYKRGDIQKAKSDITSGKMHELAGGLLTAAGGARMLRGKGPGLVGAAGLGLLTLGVVSVGLGKMDLRRAKRDSKLKRDFNKTYAPKKNGTSAY